MDSGLLYVIFNKWITDPETDIMPYKIGITRNSVEDRYYGLGLKMPGKFETLFAYKIKDCAKAEQSIHNILNNNCVNGEWFILNQEDIDFIKKICERMNGEIVTGDIENEIKEQTELNLLNNQFKSKSYDIYDEDQEIKKIERKIGGWFSNKHQENSKILYAFIDIYEKNNGVVKYKQLEEKSKVNKFKGNYDQMKNFGSKNHGKIFEQDGQNIYLWDKVEKIIWNYYNRYVKKANGT